jgi:DNA-binding PadR family transcriptional regulator
MSLRYALLAVLTVEPMTGYDLSKLFQQSVAHVWNAPDSQIYPELRKMEAEGLLLGSDVPWGPRGRKRRYAISDAGRESFRAWMNEPISYFLERDPAHLKAAYLEWSEPAAAREILQGHKDHFTALLDDWTKRLAEINNLSNPLLVKRLEISLPDDQQKVVAYKRYTYEGLIARAELEINWADRGLKLVDSFETK